MKGDESTGAGVSFTAHDPAACLRSFPPASQSGVSVDREEAFHAH